MVTILNKPLNIILLFKYLIVIRPHQRQHRRYTRVRDRDVEQRQDDGQRNGLLRVFRFFSYTILSIVITDNIYYDKLIIKYRHIINARIYYNNISVKFQNVMKCIFY